MGAGYAAAFATLGCWTVATFVLARLSRIVMPDLLNKASLFFSSLLLGALVCVVDGIDLWELFTKPNTSNWLWLGLSGIIGKTIGDYCGLVCLRIAGPYRRSLFTTLTPGFIWILGLFLLDEHINVWAIIGMFITMFALLRLLRSQSEQEEVYRENYGNFRTGALMGVGAAVFTALAFIFSKKTFIETGYHISEFHATWIRVFVALIALWLIDLVRNKNHHFVSEFFKTREKIILLFLGILFSSILGLSFSLMAIIRMETSVAFTIFSLVPLVVIIVSAIVFKRSIPILSWLWMLLAISGTVLMIWRNELD